MADQGFLGRLMEFLLPSYALIWAISLLVKLKRRFVSTLLLFCSVYIYIYIYNHFLNKF